jgi:RimJ/RimL family protein N-acetyltransferase
MPNDTDVALGTLLRRYRTARGLSQEKLAEQARRALISIPTRLRMLRADCDPRNRASYRVLEKIGMRREAHFRENAWIKGEWTDSLIYAILARESRQAT